MPDRHQQHPHRESRAELSVQRSRSNRPPAGEPAVLTRRAFLATALAGTASAALGGRSWAVPIWTEARPDPGARKRVVIVGAGLAGLTSALDLVGAGWDVVVLEARQRVGGRVHTLYRPFANGLHAEAGGESIDDNHDRLQELIARFGLRTERRPPNKLLESVVYRHRKRGPLTAFLQGRQGTVLQDYLRFNDALDRFSEGVEPVHP